MRSTQRSSAHPWLSSAVVLLLCCPLTVLAQNSRTELIAGKQKEKATDVRVYEPNKLEKLLDRVEDGGWFFSPNPRGFYPYFDSVHPGGGLTLGAGYRKYFADEAHADVRGLYSFLNYKLIEGLVGSPNHKGGLFDFGTRVGWRDATQVGYYGLGNDSVADDRANFRLSTTYVDGSVTARPVRWIHLVGGAAYEDFQEKEGQGSDPSIETIYTPGTAPHLGTSPSYGRSYVSAGIYWLDSPLYSRKGGLYRFTFHDYRNVGGDIGSFQLRRGEIVQHLPILRETWVLSLRGRVESVLGTTSDVPYFLMPSLGGGSTLRAYSTARFRDRNSLLVSGEWRWIPNRLGIDMAFFYDAGKVTPRWNDLNFKGLKHNFGVGFRIHNPVLTLLRLDLAKGSEGWHLVISNSAPF